MSGGVRPCFHFPPYNHSLLPCEDTAFDFIGHTFPRQFLSVPKPDITGMTVPPFGCRGRLGKAPT